MSDGSRARRARAVELYQEDQMTAEDIAKEVGVSRATLYNWLGAAGVAGRRGAATDDSDPVLDAVEAIRSDLRDLTAAVNRCVGALEALVALSRPRD